MLREILRLMIILVSTLVQLNKSVNAKYVMLTSPYAPMVYCTVGDTVKANFKGLDIEMFNKIAIQLGWSDSDFSYECIDYSQMNSKLSQISNYVGFIGGLTIDSKREQEGIFFSYPMWNTGISIILYNKNEFWLQVTVLTSQLCGIVVATSLIIGVLHFYLEQQEFSLEQFLWNSMTSIFFITTINLKRSGSRLIQISFWFMIMVVSSNYLAKMTNVLTIEQPLIQIKSPYDLNNKRVITYSIYTYQLYQFGSIPLTSDFGSSESTTYDEISQEQITKNLSRDDEFKVDAYAIDDIQAQLFEYTNCNLYHLGRNFYQFNYGIAFYKDQDNTLISQINKQIQLLTINQSTEKQISDYISKNYNQCVKDSQDDHITMNHVGGLFVLQAIAICVGILLFSISKVPLYRRMIKKLEKYNIISVPKLDEKDIHGDELVLQNIKQVTKDQIMNFEQIIEDRLDEMDENIIKFYEILLNEEQLKKLKIIQDNQTEKKQTSNSLSKNEEGLQNGSLKKLEKKESNFSQIFNELQITKHSSEIRYDKPESSSKTKTELKIIGEVEMAEFDQDQESIDQHFS